MLFCTGNPINCYIPKFKYVFKYVNLGVDCFLLSLAAPRRISGIYGAEIRARHSNEGVWDPRIGKPAVVSLFSPCLEFCVFMLDFFFYLV